MVIYHAYFYFPPGAIISENCGHSGLVGALKFVITLISNKSWVFLTRKTTKFLRAYWSRDLYLLRAHYVASICLWSYLIEIGVPEGSSCGDFTNEDLGEPPSTQWHSCSDAHAFWLQGRHSLSPSHMGSWGVQAWTGDSCGKSMVFKRLSKEKSTKGEVLSTLSALGLALA